MFLKKKKNCGNSSRHCYGPKFLVQSFFIKYKFFFFKKKSSIGKNLFNQTILFSKIKSKGWVNKSLLQNFWNLQTSVIIGFKSIINKQLILLIKFTNGSLGLFKSIFGLFVGDFINYLFFFTRKPLFFYLGWQCLLGFLPRFIFISNIYFYKYKHGILSSAPGTYTQILNLSKDKGLVKLKLPSGKFYWLLKNTACLVGRNNNIFKKYSVFGYFKPCFNLGKKPKVRGVAMNPVDHPHGGRTKTNKPEVSPWNWIAKYSH